MPAPAAPWQQPGFTPRRPPRRRGGFGKFLLTLVMVPIVFFAALTIVGYLLTDIFYAMVDPRVRLS